MASTSGLVRRLTKNINKLLSDCDGGVDTVLNIKNEYYINHAGVLKNVLFRDTFYVSRFAHIHFELIVSKNTSIHYLMKHQFKNGDLIYDLIFDSKPNKLGSILEKIETIDKDLLDCYYNEIQKQVICPLLNRHDIYSDNLFNIIFYKLLLHTGYMYSHCNEFKKSISELLNVKTNDMKFITKLPILFENKMILEERNVWLKMIK